MTADGINWGWVMQGIALIITLVLALYSCYRTNQGATRTEIERIREAYGDLSIRMSMAEQTIKVLPTSDDFHKIELGVTEVRGSVNVMNEQMKPLAAGMRRVEDFLLQQSQRRP